MKTTGLGEQEVALSGGKAKFLVWLDQPTRQRIQYLPVLRLRLLLRPLGIVARVLYRIRMPLVLHHEHRVNLSGQVLIPPVFPPDDRVCLVEKPAPIQSEPSRRMSPFVPERKISKRTTIVTSQSFQAICGPSKPSRFNPQHGSPARVI